ncbi:MAG: efflux RND transporter permease subunit, partial [Myxococcales bacterium]|nr:efflux RND transporter permease subunit [Myxococcales bacterium]
MLEAPHNPRRWSFSDLALSRPVMVGMLLTAILILGVLATIQLPLAFMPSRQGSNVSLRFQVARTSPELLERDIIRPIEEQVAGLRGLQQLRVGSGSWGVRVNLEFAPGTDIDARKQEIRERMDRIRPELPETLTRIEIDSSGDADEPIMELRVASERELSSQYDLIQQHIVRPLERIPGVSRIEFNGVGQNEFEVALDLESASRAGIALEDVGAALRDARQGRSLGLMRASDTVPGVRSPAREADPAAYAELPLRRQQLAAAKASNPALDRQLPGGAARMSASGLQGAMTSVPERAAQADEPATASPQPESGLAQLGDVAGLAIQPTEVRAFRRLDGLGGINMSVYAQAGYSPVEVSLEVQRAIQEITSTPELGDIHAVVFHDQGEIITSTLGDLKNTGVYGGILGVIVLFLFLRRMTTTLVAAACIPLTILATCGVLFLRGEELNCIVLLGLVLGVGMLIDNAVVIVESIENHARLGESVNAAIARGSREVGLATIASTVSSVIVFLPLVFGDQADPATTFLKPLGITFATVLLCSLIVSQTSVPLLMKGLLGGKRDRVTKPHRAPLLDATQRAYGWLIRKSLGWPRLTMLLALAIVATAAYPATQLNYRIGEVDEQPNDLPIGFEFVGSPSYQEIGEHLKVLEAALLERREELGIMHVSCSYSDWWAHCSVHPLERANSEADVERFRGVIEKALPPITGVRYFVGEDRHGRWRRGDRKEVQIAIKGDDMGVLMELADRAVTHLRATLPRGDADDPEAGGYDTITGPMEEGNEEIHIELDPAKLQRAGLTADQVSRFVSTAFQGLPLGQVRGPTGEIELRLST